MLALRPLTKPSWLCGDRWFLFSALKSLKVNNNLVNIIEKWGILEEYAGEKLGFYRLLDRGDKAEIRVQTGRIGYVEQFDSLEDENLKKILDFCRKRGFIELSEHIRDEDFFK